MSDGEEEKEVPEVRNIFNNFIFRMHINILIF